MTESSETDQPAAPETPGSAKQPARWWLGVIIFVGGLTFGVLLVGLLRAGTPQFGTVPGAGGSPGTAPSVDSGVPVVAQAEVNAACLRVINEAQDISAILAGLGQVVRDVDLQQIDDMVRQLQPVEARLQTDLADCRVNTNVVGGGTPTPTPSSTLTPPTPSPLSPSPTSPSPTR